MRRAFVITVATLAGCSSSDGAATPSDAEAPVAIEYTECGTCMKGSGHCCGNDLEGRACDTSETCWTGASGNPGAPAFALMQCVKGRWKSGGTMECNPPGWGSYDAGTDAPDSATDDADASVDPPDAEPDASYGSDASDGD